MTQSEALLFFPFEIGEDIEELYEERLFEYKQYFISKSPIEKVFVSKLKKLRKMHSAYVFFDGEEKILFKKEMVFTFSSNLKEAFSSYQKYRNTIRIEIQNSRNGLQLENIINEFLKLQKAYYFNWIDFDFVEVNQLSIEPDYMLFLNAVNELEQMGILTFSDLKMMKNENIQNNSVKMILMESKRLSLLRKMEENE